MVYAHGGFAGCVTVMVWPAMSTVPVRESPVFSETVRPTLPLPVAFAPPAMVIHAAFDVDVHAHPVVVVTVIDVVPPVGGAL